MCQSYHKVADSPRLHFDWSTKLAEVPARMSDASSTPKYLRLLLGPQRFQTTLGDELARTVQVPSSPSERAPVAAITAGWQEREAEVEELEKVVDRPVFNLRLHARADVVFAQDPELLAQHRRKQDRLRRLQELYRVRLRSLAGLALRLSQWEDYDELVAEEYEQIVQSMRRLDAHHTQRVSELEQQFISESGVLQRAAVVRHRAVIEEKMADCTLVLIAGGHVASLLNRMRLFGVGDWLVTRDVVAWSGGAMILTERVVLFHDDPTLGRRTAEILGPGLGIAPSLVALPHARHRLRLDDRHRVGLLAQRFAPQPCVTLDGGARLEWTGTQWLGNDVAEQLFPDGTRRSRTGYGLSDTVDLAATPAMGIGEEEHRA